MTDYPIILLNTFSSRCQFYHQLIYCLTQVLKYGLDEDQTNAFLVIANQVLDRELYRRKITKEPPKQMIMYLGGEGGTGKSKVIKAVTTYMSGLGSRFR